MIVYDLPEGIDSGWRIVFVDNWKKTGVMMNQLPIYHEIHSVIDSIHSAVKKYCLVKLSSFNKPAVAVTSASCCLSSISLVSNPGARQQDIAAHAS